MNHKGDLGEGKGGHEDDNGGIETEDGVSAIESLPLTFLLRGYASI